MPRLLIDGMSIVANAKGVGRYTYHMCCQLEQRLPAAWEIYIVVDSEYRSPFTDGFKATIVPVKTSSDLHLGLIVIPGIIKRYGIDLLLRTRDCVGKDYGIPAITVCHDVNELISKAQNYRPGPLRYFLDSVKEHFRVRAMRISKHVICNSQFTQNAVSSHYGIDKNKTSVGYCGIDPRFYTIAEQVNKDLVRKKYGVSNYILTFSTGDTRENYSLLPEIIAEVKRLGNKTCFIIAGVKRNAPYSKQLFDALLNAGLVNGEDFLFEDFLGEDRFGDLVSLYSAADFYLELSLHEGFGMQLAEAMACGTSVITPIHSALGEVVGRFAIPINLGSANEIASRITNAYAQSLHLRDNSDQVEFSKRYAWDAVGNLTSKLIASIGSDPGKG